MSQKPTIGNCFVYLRDHKRSEFRAGAIALRDKKDLKNPGDLWPRKSSRSYVTAFPQGTGQEMAELFLDHCVKLLNHTRPLHVEALLQVRDKAVEVGKWSDIKLDAAEAVGLPNLLALNCHLDCPFEGLLVFGNARHWKDARDDAQGALGAIRDGGMLRGYVNVPWGLAEIFEERANGIFTRFAETEWREGTYGDPDDDEY